MNKTININLAGIIFYVDEDAYSYFNTYLQTVKAQFANAEEREEIIADIEARIAELLQSKISDSKQVITRADVDQIIAVMGSPEDFSNDEDEAAEAKKAADGSSKSFEYNGPKRLYRNPDDKILGGVSGGIAAYFGIDPLWVRIIWIALFFGWGTGFFIYIILWIVMPEAKTTAQKLQMRGEPININNIERSVKEEMKDVKERFDKYRSSGKPQTAAEKAKDAIQEIVSAILNIFKYIFTFFFKFIGVILMIVGVIILISFISLFLGNDFNINGTAIDWANLSAYLDSLFVTSTQKSIFLIGVVMLALAPIIGAILLGMRLLFNYRSQGKFTAAGLIFISILGFIMLFATLTFLVKGFAAEATYAQTIDLSGDRKSYVLKVTDFIDDERPYDLDWTVTEKYHLLADVDLNVKQTLKAKPYLEITTESRGKNRLDARQRAKNFTFYTEQVDSVINLADYFLVPSDEKYRGQNLDLVLYLPVGYSVLLDESTANIINDIKNVTNTYDGDMLDHTWVMTEAGLVCMDCTGEQKTEWKSNDDWEKDSYENQFEEEAKQFEADDKQRLNEAEQKLKEAQQEIDRIKADQKKK